MGGRSEMIRQGRARRPGMPGRELHGSDSSEETRVNQRVREKCGEETTMEWSPVKGETKRRQELAPAPDQTYCGGEDCFLECLD